MRFGNQLLRTVALAWLALPATARMGIEPAYAKLPVSFEVNRGQAAPEVKFLARGRNYDLYLTTTGTVLAGRGGAVRMKFQDANRAPEVEGVEPLAARSSYFLGSDPRQWRTNIPHYARVRYRNVYPGVSLLLYGAAGRLEYDFIVAPGADPGRIRMAFEGAEELRLEASGDLIVRAAGGEIRQFKPVAYQEVAGVRKAIEGRYLVKGRQVGFQIGRYDASRPLVIDPVLGYSTYLGGSGGERIHALAVDASGNAYLTGVTNPTSFPTTTGAYRGPSGGDWDVVVAKLNGTGTALVYSTYFGGGSRDWGSAVAVDAAGNAYVTGYTESSNFPTTPGALRTASGGGSDAFVLKLNPTGSALIYSTYLGGTNRNDSGYGIAVDKDDNAYVTGETSSSNFPTTTGAYRTSFGGGDCGFLGFSIPCYDAFVAKLNPAGARLVYSTYLGGNKDDWANAIAIDAAGNAYVTGRACSTNFPTTPGAFRSTYGGGYTDVFVTKLNAEGAAAIYSTYLGGTNGEEGWGIAADSAGNAWVTGVTYSTDFPTSNPLQRTFGGDSDVFVTKLNPTGAPVYSTYLGGAKNEEGAAVAVDASGNAYIAGGTTSANFPLASPLQASLAGSSDAFVLALNAQGSALLFSSYLGGSAYDRGNGIALDSSGNLYVAGQTESNDFPTSQGALQAVYGGPGTDPGSWGLRGDGFVVKIADPAGAGAAVTTLSAASFSGLAIAPESIVSAFGKDLATATQVADTTPLPTELAGTKVKVTDSAGAERLAQLFFVSPGQVNLLIPAGTATGLATISITSASGTTTTGKIRIEAVAPGLFSANADGKGVAAALTVRAKADGSQTTELVFRYDAAQNKRVAVPIDLRPQNEQVVLLLFGTGLRFNSGLAGVSVKIGGQDCEVLYAGPQGEFAGLDQVNVRLPRTLIGRGEVEVALKVDGKAANVVTLFMEGQPRITAVDPNGGRLGETINITITGENLADITKVEFSPSAGISVTNVQATATKVTAQVSISANADFGERLVFVTFPAGTSEKLFFLVRPKAGSNAPVIYNFKLTDNYPQGDTAILGGSFEFEDPDGDIVYTGSSQGSATIQYSVGGCTKTFTGTFLDKRGQKSGTVTFRVSYSWSSLVFSSSKNTFRLIDAAGNRSNYIETTDSGGFCRLDPGHGIDRPLWNLDHAPEIYNDRRRREFPAV
jgi:uncharacterized protein (TIGR03437 family)